MLGGSQRFLKASGMAACLLATLVVVQLVVAADDDSAALGFSDVANTPNNLSISTRKIDFGAVTPGEADTAIVVFTHDGAPGSGDIIIENLFLDEVDSKSYTLSTNTHITLAPSQSVDLVVGFEPDRLGPMPGSLMVTHTGKAGVDVIELYGEGVYAPVLGAADPLSLPFGKSNLAGFVEDRPTSLQFGADGKLYVATMYGDLHVLGVERKGANDYQITSHDDIDLIKNILNHDDDGSVREDLNQRLVTGLLVVGTASEPVVYVMSSDPRIGGGVSGATTNLDTNSGVLSRLRKTSAGWQKLDLVRGLPRSEENHHGNGMAINGSLLYVAYGGNTNMGAPSNNFAMLPEYALSAAILSIDLDKIGEQTYDLPTLDDEDRNGPDDSNDPFGGNGGKNQAMIVDGGPVQVYAPGFRNPYDVVVMENGRMYTWDNGPNSGWGGAPGSCYNDRSEPGITQHDALHLITGPGYYGGHPNPTRGDQKNTFNKKSPQSPVPYANAVECNYYGPGTYGNGKNSSSSSLISLPRSTNGLAEYTASNLSGELTGELLVASWDNKIYRASFTDSGQLDELNVLFSNVGISPLDVTSQADNAVFPGTIWVADFRENSVVVYEPDDYEGGGTAGVCNANGGTVDADNDGFSDDDEKANGTDGCSAADFPADVDGDFLSDLVDSDDDNDGIADVDDPFAIDPANGENTPLPVDYQWENDSDDPGFLSNLGFSGLMTNGTDNYEAQFDLNEMTIIGAAGVVTVDSVPKGDPLRQNNSQQYGFQFGVDVDASSQMFRVQTRILAPFSGFQSKLHQSMGLFIGTGDQDNYAKLVIKHNGTQLLTEIEGNTYSDQQSSFTTIDDADYVDLTIEIDPASAIATAFVQISTNNIVAAEKQVGTVDFPASWLNGSTRLAIGIISTSIGAQPFPATWDFLTVTPVGGSVFNNAPSVAISAPGDATVGAQTMLSATVTDDGLPNNNTSQQWSQLSGPADVSFANDSAASTAIMFSEPGVYELMLSATDGDYTVSDSVAIEVSDGAASAANVVYRINAGGPQISAQDGNWISDSASSQYVNTGMTWKTNAAIDVSNMNSYVPSSLFKSERYDKNGGPELEWTLPVTPGEYVVRLYFAEIYFGTMKPGGRVFNVAVEGQSETGIDVFASVGANKAMMKSFTVQSDDTLNIQLTRTTQNPAIKAIEVLRYDDSSSTPDNKSPVVSAGANMDANTSEAISLAGVVSDDGLPSGATAMAWSMVMGPAIAQFSDQNNPATDVIFSVAGTYVLRLSANDGALTSSDDVQITVKTKNTAISETPAYRINVGGPSITDENGDWAADTGSSSLASTGRTYSKNTAIDTSATPGIPASVFQSERWDPKGGASMSWKLPVAPGNYDVHLYFAEIYSGAMGDGKRVFNVSVEGQSVGSMDVFAEAGAANTGLVKSFAITTTDGVIDILFEHIKENPAIKGIEVVARGN